MPAKGGSSGRLPGSRGGSSSRGGSFLSKQGGTYTANSASKASKNQSINSSGMSPKSFRKGNAAANRDLGWSKSTNRASKKYGSGRMGAEGPKKSAPVKKRGR